MCSARTELRRLDGVHDAGAGFESIAFFPAWAIHDPEQMIDGIGELGYTAAVVEER